MERNYYNLELGEIYNEFKTNPDKGLTNEQSQNRLKTFGFNELPKVSRGFIKIYLSPLFNWLIVIYLGGALLLFLSNFFSDSSGNFIIIGVTLGVVLLNCLVAIIQQFRATKKLKALRELSAPTTKVIREGLKTEILTKEVVVGDLLVLSQGDRIPADSRIIKGTNFEINEASLTGESEPVRKLLEGQSIEGEKPIQDRKNMLFYGTFVTMGNGTAIAVNIGGDTEIGQISKGLEEAGTSEIPIRKKMNNFGKWLGLGVLLLWFIIFMFKLLINLIDGIDTDFQSEFFKSLNSALDLLPMNIPLLTTLILITGVLAMAHQGVIIRNLASVDSLGRVSIVCSDKTGTLTKNQMSVQHIWSNGSIFKVTGSGYTPEGEIIIMDDPKNLKYVKHIEDYQYLKIILISGFLNNNSALVKSEIETSGREGKIIDNWKVIGSPTEGALVVLFQKIMGDYLLEDYKLIEEFPFDSNLKRMTKIYKKDDQYFSFTKGASEILIPKCAKIFYKNTEVEFNDKIIEEVQNNILKYASQGYRILSLCYKKFFMMPHHEKGDREQFESELVYLGFVTILDPPREGVRKSVEQCHNAGVDVIMITGDSDITAKAIGGQISIMNTIEDKVAEGKNIDKIESYDDFKKIKVFARVSPKHKEDIIKRYQEKKKVVAMTGDGVNDTLALNMADCGIAMGIQGTDVAKEASDMVISDDSFTSIVTGIHQGRGIFAKIRAIVFFFICVNVFEGLVQFILAVILNFPYWVDPNSPFYYQWIFLTLTLHILPGFVLTFDTTSDDVMKEKPRDSEEILSKKTLLLMIAFGILLSTCMIITYFLCYSGIYPVTPENYAFGVATGYFDPLLYKETKALTMLMLTLFFCENFLVWQIRRPNKSLFKSLKEDRTKFLIFTPLFLFLIFAALMYIPDVQLTLEKFGFPFRFMMLTGMDWLVCILISSICILSFEIIKYIARKKNIVF
ncbi:MAG: cation-transporting P-type ATPase [Candidatus Lokiarchaeota archaeon]|nr:cation-transporting P-type ATPase [Candidatus Lokiarchaeota archaeon]